MLQCVLRFSKYALAVIVLILGAALASIHTLIDESVVEKQLKSLVSNLFDVTLEIDGKLSIERLPVLAIDIPSARFVKDGEKEGEKEILASFEKGHFEVALWSLPLGAKQVTNAHISGLKTKTRLSAFDGDALFGETFAPVKFPSDFRLQDLRLSNALVDVVYGEQNRLFKVSQLNVKLGKVAPEMKSPIELHMTIKSDTPEETTTSPTEFSQYLPVSIDTNHIDAEVSLKGTLAISDTRRYVMLDDLQAASEFNEPNNHYTIALRADRLRMHRQEFAGMNVVATLSQPLRINGDIQLAAVDFKYNPDSFVSPEMRLSYKETKDNCTSSYEVAGSVKSDLVSKKVGLENMHGAVSVNGGNTLPENFNTTFAGTANLDFAAQSAETNISGDFATVPFAYRGTIADLNHPKLHGELDIGSVNILNLPAFKNLQFLSALDFTGDFRVGKIQGSSFEATQLKGALTAAQGKAELKNAAVNLANGLVQFELTLNENYNWNGSAQVQSVNLDTLFSRASVSSLITGSTVGKFTLSGTGLNVESLSGQGEMQLRNGLIRRLDSRAVHERIAKNNSQRPYVGEKLSSDLREAEAILSLKGNVLTMSRWSCLSGFDRAVGNYTIDLAAGSINGTTNVTYAPVDGIPSIRISAGIEGDVANPTWNFNWNDSSQAFARSQGIYPQVKKPKKNESDLLKNIKEFFKF